MNGFALAWRLARRELRGGLSGFRIFFASLVLGVMAIAGTGSLAQAMLTGLAQQGRVLLGGDVQVNLVHRPANAQERAFLDSFGRISETTTMRAMAYAATQGANGQRTLVELKAVDGTYPLYGAVGLSPARGLQAALACTDKICGAVAEQTLLDRLQLKPGGVLRIGSQDFRVSSALTNEPDRISGGFSLGPHILVSEAALKRTGLVTIGSLINYHYRVALAPNKTVAGFKRDATAHFADAGWQVRDRNDAAPGLRRFVEQVTMFLTLVGLTALAVGGVGAAQAIGAFLDRKRAEIATLKALGAEGTLIFRIYFLQVMAIACVAVAVGLVLGAALPFGVEFLYGASLPSPAAFAIYPAPLALAAFFGMFSAAAFAIPPLARAREIAPASLFRDIVARTRARGRWIYLAAAGGCAAAVIGLALIVSPSPVFALWFLGGIAVGLALLRLAASGLRAGLKRLPRPRSPGPRLALANLTRPGRGHRRRGRGAGAGADVAGHRHPARRHDLGAGARQPARHRAQLLLHRHPAGRSQGLRQDHRELPGREGLQAHANDPWTDYCAERRAAARRQGRSRRALGAQWRPRHHLCRRHAQGHHRHRRQMVAGGLYRARR